MTNPQRENGFTAINNETMDSLLTLNLSGREFRVVLAIIRKTWGFNKKKDMISLSQLAKLTNIDRGNLSKILKVLIERCVVKTDNSYTKTYWFNKLNYEWKTVVKNATVLSNLTTSVVKTDNKTVVKNATTIDNKDTNVKDNLTISKKRIVKPCPLGTEKHTACIAFLGKLAVIKNLPNGKWLNTQKQIMFLHKLIRAGYTLAQIEDAVSYLEKDNYWWDKWDLATVVSYLEKKGREVIQYAKN